MASVSLVVSRASFILNEKNLCLVVHSTRFQSIFSRIVTNMRPACLCICLCLYLYSHNVYIDLYKKFRVGPPLALWTSFWPFGPPFDMLDFLGFGVFWIFFRFFLFFWINFIEGFLEVELIVTKCDNRPTGNDRQGEFRAICLWKAGRQIQADPCELRAE